MNVIAHNLMAMNTQRMLRTNQKKSSASSVKLSTGYKLNKAADDAAGLCISDWRKALAIYKTASASFR